MTPRHASVRRASLLLLGPLFVVAGLNHFLNPTFYLAIMPPYLPAHELLVAASGALEIAGGIGVLAPRTRVWAGRGLALLLVAVFPANVHMAMNPDLFPTVPSWLLYLRLPLQGVLIGGALWATTESHRPTEESP